MRTPLYGRDPILRALVPRLVGLAPDRRELVPQEHRDDPPVTLVTGRHGMGRTAVLDALDAAYRGRVPLGRVDAAQSEQARWSGSAASNTSALVEILEQLVCELAPVVPGSGRLRFSRLLPGLFAVSSWHRGNEGEQLLARDRIARLLVACGLEKGGRAAGEGARTGRTTSASASPTRTGGSTTWLPSPRRSSSSTSAGTPAPASSGSCSSGTRAAPRAPTTAKPP
ncbi:hypothetical protein [Streptomyces sp. KM273126]|uniref:hypothetical protein n=1 Tax=Streptomyces sp. KM273126 TaxID=2545247 RepID=UPI00215D685D|nr:hypothetical protein [Streptomyces sp. KM273126]